MIIEFSVQNFRSIYDKITLSMLASKLTGKEATLDNIFYHENYPNLPLLKSAVIYGANASGKSNVLKAVQFIKKFIRDSTDYKFDQNLPHEPFRLFKKAIDEPSCFEMDLIARDGVRYIYSFKINAEEVLEESLSAFTSRKETKLFHRKKGEKIQFSSAFKGEKKILEEQLLKNNLLLSRAANSNYEQMQKVYSYFTGSINFDFSFPDFQREYSQQMSLVNSHLKNRIIEFLKVADTGIETFEVKKVDSLFGALEFSDKDLMRLFVPDYRTEVIHTTTDASIPDQVSWNMEDESTGTQKIYHIAGYVLDILDYGNILIFDEINNSLHPHLSRFIIELFNNKKTNPHNAQLIFTTHDVSLLNKELFRRDQIWFTEKNNKGMTELYSLGSFDKKEVRWDIPFDKWYLSGRFGALPAIGDFKMKAE